MKISMEESTSYIEPEIIVRYHEMDEPLRRVVAAIRLAGGKLIGRQEERTYILNAEDVYYFEVVDGKVFLYAEKEVYETTLRLYEIESRFEDTDFFRASKSVVANLSKISSVQAVFNGRFEARLKNGEKIIISRQYVPVLKKKLGILGGKIWNDISVMDENFYLLSQRYLPAPLWQALHSLGSTQTRIYRFA